ncbi:MAG: hypothetical protein LBL02_01215 [Endomicrobium sp.]|jgi:predicted nucleic acid-binding OB-fold protein|nr:hypothetical protein [Endomicrobium sp.]
MMTLGLIFDIGQETKVELKEFNTDNFKSFYDLEKRIKKTGIIYKSLSTDILICIKLSLQR